MDVGRYEDGRVQLEGLVGGVSRMGASGAGRGVGLPVIVSFVIDEAVLCRNPTGFYCYLTS
jgi:hypothetical protein